MNLDVVLAMLQVNIAVGVLYWALPAARYRERLFQSISESFKNRPTETDKTSGLVGELLRDQDFSVSYHIVSNWRRALPERYDDGLEKTSAPLFSKAAAPPGDSNSRPWRERLKSWLRVLPLSYRWFRSDFDKYTVFALTSIVPIGLVWHLAFHPQMDTAGWFGIYVVLAVGQTFAVANVLSGVRMVNVQAKRFDNALEYVVIAVEQAAAEQDVDQPLDDG